MSDNAIMLIGVLFILSMISERIANFIKLYLPPFKPNKKFGWGNLRNKEKNSELEKLRERRILSINLLCGFITAICIQADLISIAGCLSDPTSVIGWENFQFKWHSIFGWMLTGCFISLGSKFWHDLLDMLYEIKQTRAQLNADNLQRMTKGDFNSLAPDKQKDLIEEAIQLRYNWWKTQYSGITGVGFANKITAGETTASPVLVFHVNKKVSDAIAEGLNPLPQTISYSGYEIPTDVIESKAAQAAYAYAGNDEPRKAGGSISEEGNDTTGTVGLKVYKTVNGTSKAHLLTCYHVLFPKKEPNYIDYYNNSNRPKVICPGTECANGQSTAYGEIVRGVLNEYVDAAIALLDNDTIDFESIYKIGKVNDLCPASELKNNVTIAYKTGMKTGNSSGVLIGQSLTKVINYPGGFTHTISGLLQIKMKANTGDSGAAVTDRNNRVIGILTATEGEFAYVVPMQYIINNLAINLKR